MPSFQKKAVAGLGDVRVASPGAVVTSKVRIINDLSFDPATLRGTKGSLNLDIVTQDIPRCLFAEALPKFSGKIYKASKSQKQTCRTRSEK